MSAFTRKSIADHLDSYDDEIAELQNGKRDMLNDYRAQLAGLGMGKAQVKAEVDALKSAMRRRRAIAKKGEDEIEQADALADEIFVEITARAPRAMRARENIEEFDPETGEITEQPKVETHDAEALNPNSKAVDTASIVTDGRANVEQVDVDRSAERASSAVEVGAPVSPEGATEPLANGPCGAVSESAAMVERESASAEAGVSGQPEMIPATNSHRSVSMTPLEPREANGLKGFGFTVTFSDEHSAPSSSQVAEQTGAVVPPPAAAPVAPDDFEPPAFLRGMKTMRDYRPHCLHPDNCGSSGLDHCYRCRKALETQAVEPMAVAS